MGFVNLCTDHTELLDFLGQFVEIHIQTIEAATSCIVVLVILKVIFLPFGV